MSYSPLKNSMLTSETCLNQLLFSVMCSSCLSLYIVIYFHLQFFLTHFYRPFTRLVICIFLSKFFFHSMFWVQLILLLYSMSLFMYSHLLSTTVFPTSICLYILVIFEPHPFFFTKKAPSFYFIPPITSHFQNS